MPTTTIWPSRHQWPNEADLTRQCQQPPSDLQGISDLMRGLERVYVLESDIYQTLCMPVVGQTQRPTRRIIQGKTALFFRFGICQYAQRFLEQFQFEKSYGNSLKCGMLQNGDNCNLRLLAFSLQIFRQFKQIILGNQFQKLCNYETIG